MYYYQGIQYSEKSEVLFQIICDFLDLDAEYEPRGDDTFPDFKIHTPDGDWSIVEITGAKEPWLTKSKARQFKHYREIIGDDYGDTNFYLLGMPNHRTKSQLAEMFNDNYKCKRYWVDWTGSLNDKGIINFWDKVFNQCHMTPQRKRELVEYIYLELNKIERL
jgi:hypothetical protein